MPTDWDKIGDSLVQQRAVGNVANGAAVAPQTAVDAIKAAPGSGVPAAVGMHAPEEPNDMALFHNQTAILNASPEVRSFAASNPAVATATKDDFSNLAGVAHTVNRWADTAKADFFAPGKESIHALMRDVPRWFTAHPSGSPLDMIPGFSPQDQRLGSVLADLAGVAFSPLSGALYAGARPFSYIPGANVTYDQKDFLGFKYGTATRRVMSQQETQGKIANMFGVALSGLGPEAGGSGVRPPIIDEGTFGQRLRIGGPGEVIHDAEFTDITPPGVNPADSVVHSSIAQVDAHNVSLMQDAVAQTATHTRAPELIQQFLEDHTAAKGETVSVPAETITKLWQQGHMVFQDHADQILDSLRSGADIKVPMSTYITETAGQPFAEEINKATRFRETGVSIDEAKTLPKEEAQVTIFHGGGDFDTVDPSKFGTGEPGGIRPLGKDAFYGSLATNPSELETAIEHARIYSKYGGDNAMIHAFEAGLDPKIMNLAYENLHGRYGVPGEWEAEALPWRPREDMPMAKEIGVKNIGALRRIGKWPAGTPAAEIMADIRAMRDISNPEASMLPDQTGSPEGTAQQFTPNGRVYVVKPETTDPAEIAAMLPTAQKYGGKYAMGRANTAFQFRTPEARDAFLKETASGAEPELTMAPKEPFKPEIPEDLKEDVPRIEAIAARAETAVAQVFKETALDKLFEEPKATGLTKGQFERFAERVEEARNDTIQRILEKTYKQIRRERTPEWKAAVDLYKEEGKALVEAQPNVQAYRAVKDPLFKIDTEKAAELYPDLPLPSALTKRGGLSPDEAAELTGHSSGSALVQDLYHLHEAVAAYGGTLDQYIKARVQVYAETQARAYLGYDISPEGLLKDAREAIVEPQIENLLTADLKELADNAGLPFDRKMVEARAEELFSKLTVKEATKPKAFAENMRRLGNRAEAGLIDERPIKAFEVKQQQFIQYLHMRLAFKFQKEYGAGMKVMNQIARKPIANGMDQTARNQIRGILQQVGFTMRTGKYEGVTEALRGHSLTDYVNSLMARGLQPAFAAIPNLSATEMLVDQWRGLNETVKSIAQLGRDEKRAYNQGKAQELATIGQEVKDNASKIGRPFTAGELHRLEGTLKGTVGGGSRSLGAAVSRPETFLYWLDGEKNGPLMKYLVAELQDGKYYKTDKIQKIGAAFRDFVKAQPKGWQHSLEEAVDVPELTYSRGADGKPIQWIRDRGNVIMMATHFGTESNLAKLAAGFGWDPQVMRAVANRILTEADWKYVQHILDVNKSLLPDIRALYRATVGLAMQEMPALPIPTPFGELAGGYRHISYDWNSIEEMENPETGEVEQRDDPTSLHASDLFGNQYRTSTPPNSYTLKRTNFSAPFNLEHGILHREIESVIHDLAYRKALIQATKVLRVPQVRQAMREALGPEYVNTTNSWLRDIARGSQYDQTVLKGAAALIRGIRRRFTTVQIGYNVATLLKHGGIAASHIGAEVGIPEFARASADLMNDRDLQKWVVENSGEVRGALMNLDRDVREIMQDIFRKQGFVDNYRYHAFTMFGKVKQIEATATWLAKYRLLTDKQGLSHDDAVALANKSVRDTQGAGSPVDLPQLWRGGTDFWGEVGKLSNIFTGFENTATNRAWTMIRRGGRGGGGGPPGSPGFNPGKGWDDRGPAGQRRDFQKNFSDLLAFFVVPALYATAFDTVTQGKLHKGAKNGAVFLEHYLENTLKGLLGGSVPMGNMLAELPRAIQTRGKDFGSDSPIKEMFGATVGTAVNAWDAAHGHKGQKKIEDRWVQHAMETAGYIFDLPVKPFAKGGQFLWDKSQGHVKDKSLGEWFRGLVFGPTSEEAKKRR
jgi:hypothetical protein